MAIYTTKYTDPTRNYLLFSELSSLNSKSYLLEEILINKID